MLDTKSKLNRFALLNSIGKCVVLFAVALAGCKKSSSPGTPAAVNIIQGSPNIPNLAAEFSPAPLPFYANQALIPYQSSAEFGLSPGINSFILISSADTTTDLLKGNLNLVSGGIYSLYIAGFGATPDTMLRRDTIPSYDSTVSGVRFVNLSGGSEPFNVNLQGNYPGQTEFSNIAYKTITAFKTYDASLQYGSYTFEIRDQESGNLYTTFTWNYTGTKNNTLIICGSEDSTLQVPVSVFQVNNF